MVLGEAQVAEVGESARRFPVVAAVNGCTWRTSVACVGGEFLAGLNREVCDGAGVQAGDGAGVSIELGQGPREAQVPGALAAALAADPRAAACLGLMAFAHGKEHARWIAEARQPGTCRRGVASRWR